MLYAVLKPPVRWFYSILFRIEVRGNVDLPQGGSLIVANHTSAWDPPLVGILFPRQLRYMAKAELFRIPMLGGLLRRVGAFPVARDKVDRAALRTSLRHLAEGWPVVLFPEGTRKVHDADGRPGPARRGVAFLAGAGGVPVIPVAIRGTFRFRGRIVVSIGEPLQAPAVPAANAREAMANWVKDVVMARIRTMWEASA